MNLHLHNFLASEELTLDEIWQELAMLRTLGNNDWPEMPQTKAALLVELTELVRGGLMTREGDAFTWVPKRVDEVGVGQGKLF